MALPAPGNQISFSQVNTELSLSANAQLALSYGGVQLASITAGNQVALSNNLGGTSAGDTITLSWGTTTYTINTSSWKDIHRVVNHSGHTSPQVITMNLRWSGYAYTSTYCDIYRSLNSTVSWTYVGGISSNSTDYNVLFNIINVNYNDIIRVRQVLRNTGSAGPLSYLNTEILGGSIVSGSGTVSGSGSWFNSIN